MSGPPIPFRNLNPEVSNQDLTIQQDVGRAVPEKPDYLPPQKGRLLTGAPATKYPQGL